MTFIGLSLLWESTQSNTCNGENGEKSPEGWQCRLDAKSGLWRVVMLAKMVKFLDISPIRAINYIEVYR